MQSRTRHGHTLPAKELAQQRITHDNYFHSVLGLLDVKTGAYQPELDIFSACRKTVAAKQAAPRQPRAERPPVSGLHPPAAWAIRWPQTPRQWATAACP